MKILLLSIVIVALCVLLLCFNILLRRKEFPKFDVGGNEELRKRGIRCFKDEDAALHAAGCSGKPGQPVDCEACDSCNLGARRAMVSPSPEGRDLGRG